MIQMLLSSLRGLLGKTWRLTGGWVVLCMVACNGNDAEPLPDTPPLSNIPIRWDVESVEGMKGNTRGLIENATGLEAACSTGGQSIGIWADYTINIGGTEQTSKNVFGNTKLSFFDKADGNPHSHWNYEGTDLYWAIGGEYTFRAYYPQSLNSAVVSSSDADLFMIDYNCETMQQDLMVAYNTVDTKSYKLSDPVPLRFIHTLSALRFRFQFSYDYDDTDQLTSCWLVNDAANALHTVGLMVYGDTDPTDDVGGKPNTPQALDWRLTYAPGVGVPFYEWAHGSGLPFKKDNLSYADESEKAVAYTDAANSSTGAGYATNDGWLLIPPQSSTGNVRLYFTTGRSGSVAYSVQLPQVTGTDAAGANASGTLFIPSYRYTYTITISRTDLKLTLSIAPWNRLNSSYDISF